MSQSTKPVPGTTYYETGSPEHAADLIRAHDRAAASAAAQQSPASKWLPLALGGAVVFGVAWWILRD